MGTAILLLLLVAGVPTGILIAGLLSAAAHDRKRENND